ncbi:hypothetical protein TSUD_83500 [Trifolium subterraneum]|uniref:Uncharacterized protein n=1 Tax=Trifolium subterraneum TaxID=3900 RepID=A0A2Z6NX59_TRISU|nr:hypothetical protein TSUD_83500 [Trifolium subterraneum]
MDFLVHLCKIHDIVTETGTMTTEEAICILVSSYESSENNQDVHNEVAILSKKDRGSLLSFVSGFLTFMSIGGFPSFVEDMKNQYMSNRLTRSDEPYYIEIWIV